MEKEKIYITKTPIEKVETSELELTLKENFDFDFDSDYSDFIEIRKNCGYMEGGSPIKIDNMINILQDMKKKNANYVEIDYHCDHDTYILSSYNIELSPQEDIDEFERKFEESENKKNEIRKLQNEINKLRNEIL